MVVKEQQKLADRTDIGIRWIRDHQSVKMLINWLKCYCSQGNQWTQGHDWDVEERLCLSATVVSHSTCWWYQWELADETVWWRQGLCCSVIYDLKSNQSLLIPQNYSSAWSNFKRHCIVKKQKKTNNNFLIDHRWYLIICISLINATVLLVFTGSVVSDC